MKDELVRKLNDVLAKPLITEAEVVYTLVEVRKLMDRCGVSRDDLKPIRFFCDWVVHVELDRKKGWATELLSFADRVIENNLTWETLSPSDRSFMVDTFSLGAIRTELTRWLHRQGIYTLALGHPQGWYWFIRAFASVVADCPLKLTGGAFLEEVRLEIVVGNGSGTRLDLEWSFVRKNEPKPTRWIIPTYFSKDEYGFGRNGQAKAEQFEDQLRAAGLMAPWENLGRPGPIIAVGRIRTGNA